MAKSLGAMVEALGGELLGDSGLVIQRLAPLATAQAGGLAFVAQARYASQIASTRASALCRGRSARWPPTSAIRP